MDPNADANPDPALFVSSDLQDANKKDFHAYSFLKVHLHHSSKIKGQKEVTKQKFFFIFCLLMEGRIQIRIRTKKLRIWMRIQEVQKRTNSLDPNPDADPDPEH
jgi:hypothetical protein